MMGARVRTTIQPDVGFSLCIFDFTNIDTDDEAFEAIAEAKAIVETSAPKSLHALTDITGSHASLRVIHALIDLGKHNAPYVRRSAVVGLSALQRVTLREVVRFSGRDLRAFEFRDLAIAWLRRG